MKSLRFDQLIALSGTSIALEGCEVCGEGRAFLCLSVR